VKARQRAELVVGRLGVQARASRTVQAKGCGASQLARASSACQKPRSNGALCATSVVSPTKRRACAITSAAGGASATMALVMPVSCVMNGGMRTPAFIRLWNWSTTRPPSTHDGHLGGARALGGRAAGGLEVDDGDGRGHEQKRLKRLPVVR
jgi:hypothetical protein